MRLFAVGISHRTAPVELREAVDFARKGIDAALAAFAARRIGDEAVVLSTCNRAEIYAVGESDAAVEDINRFFSEYHGIESSALADHLYCHRGSDAARHLFRVAAGLDSLVVGEPQILGQVKAAYTTSSDMQCTGTVTHRLFHSAFAVGKRVRSETSLGEGAVSVSYAAIELARKIFGELSGLSVLILGAGEMAELTGVHLRAQQVRHITIASRTFASADALARQLNGEAIAWHDLPRALAAADIIVTATGATDPVLTKAAVDEVMRGRRQRPLFVIDIALPRDVEPSVGDLEQVFLYHMDDLQSIVSENLARRGSELASAEAIVDQEVSRFVAWLQSREIIPTVVALRRRFEEIRQSELRRLEPKLAGLQPDARARVDEITRLMFEKLLLTPTENLKGTADDTNAAAYAEALHRLFALDGSGAMYSRDRSAGSASRDESARSASRDESAKSASRDRSSGSAS
ncbi:MAG TPA: glutamyl-tRNA reductase, partial [Vicinamibacterales bacterium]|nr:glutamyl-tRNA reductase [Vicinamibacterales bacterium]